MHDSATLPLWGRLLPWVVVVALLLYRSRRPQLMSVRRLWLWPILMVALVGFGIYAAQAALPAPPGEIAVAILLGVVIGAPFGILRGMHTDVRLSERLGYFYLGSSWVTIVVFLAAFGLRAAVRSLVPQGGSLATLVGDGSLGFAVGFVVASYVGIFRKYEALRAAGLPATPTETASHPLKTP